MKVVATMQADLKVRPDIAFAVSVCLCGSSSVNAFERVRPYEARAG